MGENITKHHPAMSTETEDHYRNYIYKGIEVGGTWWDKLFWMASSPSLFNETLMHNCTLGSLFM